MRQKTLFQVILHSILIISIISVSSCKKSGEEETDSGTVEKIKKSVAFTATALNSAGSVMMDSATGLSGPVPSKAYANNLSYDTLTGWWTLQTSLSTGENAELQFQFIDSHGDFRKFYSNLIVKINTKGTISGSSGDLNFNIEITGFTNGDEEVVLNGSGSISYLGSSGSFNLNNVTVAGYSDYAVSGTLTVVIEGVSVSISYNGNSKIIVTFNYNGKNYSFTINLDTGNIS